jgi:hypothetical protein
MRSHEFITEALTTPYNFDDYNMDVTFGSKGKHGGKKGSTATFYTSEGNKYKITAIKLGLTKAQRDRIKHDDEKYKDDEFYIPDFGDYGGIWEVHFNLHRVEWDKSEYYDNRITGTGDALRVFATVMQFLERLKNDKDPDIVSIKSKAEEGSRTSLYMRMAKRFAPQMGYEVIGMKQAGDKQRIELRKK